MGDNAIAMNRPLTLTLPLGGGRENTPRAITQKPSPLEGEGGGEGESV